MLILLFRKAARGKRNNKHGREKKQKRDGHTNAPMMFCEPIPSQPALQGARCDITTKLDPPESRPEDILQSATELQNRSTTKRAGIGSLFRNPDLRGVVAAGPGESRWPFEPRRRERDLRHTWQEKLRAFPGGIKPRIRTPMRS